MRSHAFTKGISLLTALALCFTLFTGFLFPHKTVEKAIDSIGTVTLDSLSAIESAEAQYAELPDKSKQKVDNYADLTAARKAYEQQLDEVDAVIDAIDGMGDITQENISQLLLVTAAFDALNTSQQEAVTNRDSLDQARTFCQEQEEALVSAVAACADTFSYTDICYTSEEPPFFMECKNEPLVQDAITAYDQAVELGFDASMAPYEETVSLMKELYKLYFQMNALAYEQTEGDAAAEKWHLGMITYFPTTFEADTSRTALETYYRETGFEAYQAGDYLTALEWYEKILTVDPTDLKVCTALVALGDEALQQGDYTAARDYYDQCLTYDPEAKIANLATLYLAELEEELDGKDYIAILDKLTEAEETYGKTADTQEFREKVNTLWDKSLPADGKVFHNSIYGGYANIWLQPKDVNLYGKIESVDDPGKYVTFFVRSNSSGGVSNLPDGKYTVKCAIGNYWENEQTLFGEDTKFYQFTKTVTAWNSPTEYRGGYAITRTSSDKFTVTVSGKDMKSYRILSQEDF